MGLVKHKKPRWTNEEEIKFVSLYALHTMYELEIIFNRSRFSLNKKAAELNLSKKSRFDTYNASNSNNDYLEFFSSIDSTVVKLNKNIYKYNKNFGVYIIDSQTKNQLTSYQLVNIKKDYAAEDLNLMFFYSNQLTEKELIVKSMIASKLNKTKKIGARKLSVKNLSNKESKKFFDENHISGGVNSVRKTLGLCLGEEILAAASFAKSRFSDHSVELIRFANKLDITVVGGLSKLLKHSKYEKIMTFADLAYSTGKGYESIGLKYSHTSKGGYLYTTDGLQFFHRVTFQKHKIPDYAKSGKYGITSFDINLTEEENMLNNGYYKIPTLGNLVYLYEL